MILSILNEIVKSNSTKQIVEILKREQDNELFKKVVLYALSPNILFYIKAIEKPASNSNEISLEEAFKVIDSEILSYKVTGNKAYTLVSELLSKLSENDSEVLHRVIQKNLLCSLGYKTVNEVYKKLIPETPYMRCSSLDEKTMKNISFPATLQVKEDGQFINFIASNGTYKLLSRNGKELFIEDESFKDISNHIQDVVIMGELLVMNTKKNEILKRQTGNGYIQRGVHDNPNYKIFIRAWDIIPYENWLEGIYKVEYSKRFEELLKLQKLGLIQCVESIAVNNVREAVEITKKWISEGLEGGILKDSKGEWKDGTSRHQIKIKGAFEVDLKIVDILPGNEYSSCAGVMGSLVLESSDGEVKCKVGTGFTYEQRKEIWDNKDKYIGKIVAIIANKLTKDKSLYLPRIVEIRSDKDYADDYKQICINSKGL